jgi:hypothetical protein
MYIALFLWENEAYKCKMIFNMGDGPYYLKYKIRLNYHDSVTSTPYELHCVYSLWYYIYLNCAISLSLLGGKSTVTYFYSPSAIHRGLLEGSLLDASLLAGGSALNEEVSGILFYEK